MAHSPGDTPNPAAASHSNSAPGTAPRPDAEPRLDAAPRPDLLDLTDATLTDLTNRGTVRRARKELEGTQFTFSGADGGTIIVEASDGTRCELRADRPFDEWPCTCLAATKCRHVVRAVLAYQAHAQHTGGPTGADPHGAPPEHTRSDNAQPHTVQPRTVHADTAQAGPAPPKNSEPAEEQKASAPIINAGDPATVTDDALKAALGRTFTKAQRLREGGIVGRLTDSPHATLMLLYFPSPVTVRFLAGTNLDYARCTCAHPDPCEHVALAVWAARAEATAGTELREVPGGEWEPDRALLDSVIAHVDELLRVGADSGHDTLAATWRRLATRLEAADMPHLADLVADIIAEQERFAGRRSVFDPLHLVRLCGELIARVESLRSSHPGRVPDRLVAGALADPARLGKARLIGMGCSVVEHQDGCTIVAHLVDARSGMPVRVSVAADGPKPAGAYAGRSVAGVGIGQWGSGQVLIPRGLRDARGELTVHGARVNAAPAPALAELPPPFLAETFRELSAQVTCVPAVLDDRSAGTAMAAIRITQVGEAGFDPKTSAFTAEIFDADGGSAIMELKESPRSAGAREELSRVLERVRLDTGADGGVASGSSAGPGPEVFVAGRWNRTTRGLRVEPTLVVADGKALQPQLAGRGQRSGEDARSVATGIGAPLTSAGALMGAVDSLLGDTLVGGLERVGAAPWRRLAARARDAGSTRIAAHAHAATSETLRALLLASAFAGGAL